MHLCAPNAVESTPDMSQPLIPPTVTLAWALGGHYGLAQHRTCPRLSTCVQVPAPHAAPLSHDTAGLSSARDCSCDAVCTEDCSEANVVQPTYC